MLVSPIVTGRYIAEEKSMRLLPQDKNMKRIRNLKKLHKIGNTKANQARKVEQMLRGTDEDIAKILRGEL